jgi:hypothetical protein
VDGAIGRSPVHPIKRNGSAHVPAGTGSLFGCSPTKLLRGSDDLPVEQLSGFQHGMHDDGKFSRHCNGSMLEADPLSELQAPFSQGAFSSASGQDHAGRFEEKASDLVVAASGDMAVVVDLTGLVSSSGSSAAAAAPLLPITAPALPQPMRAASPYNGCWQPRRRRASPRPARAPRARSRSALRRWRRGQGW